jgi:hypothetical protein
MCEDGDGAELERGIYQMVALRKVSGIIGDRVILARPQRGSPWSLLISLYGAGLVGSSGRAWRR